jgi:tetratricopeptide (TPR) repeat protein
MLSDQHVQYLNRLKENPSDIETRRRLARLYFSSGDLPSALPHFKAWAELAPDDAQAYYELGLVLANLGNWEEAIQAWRQSLIIAPGNAAIYSDLSVALGACGKIDEAITAAREAIAIDPTMAAAYNNLGGLLNEKGEFDESIPIFRKAIYYNAHYPDAYLNLGNALQQNGNIPEALQAYQKATSLNPNHAAGQFNESLAQLLTGNFREGWKKYEYRWDSAQKHGRRNFSQPLWLGDPRLAGKKILLHAEQGFGDTFQFVRYVEAAAEHGAIVYLEVQSPLKGLMSKQWPSVRVFAPGEALPAFDLHCPLLSLPLAFETQLSTIPRKVPYISAPTDKISYWQHQLKQRDPVARENKIGIVWAGNSKNATDRFRSIPLSELRPLLATPDCRFFVLQKEISTADHSLLKTMPQVVNLSSELEDFSDTAAIISQLDLIISVETAVAHLAGAMGMPTWIPLPVAPSWRWLLEREDSPWYPTVRLFRQIRKGDWSPVVQEMAEALRNVEK